MASKSSSRVLTDHDEIRSWAEERGAKPATVRNTHTDDNIGIIRLDFPGYSGEGSLEEIEWDEWFDNFDDNNLALIVQDETADGEKSNFNKLVNREHVETEHAGKSKSKKSTFAGTPMAKISSSRSESKSSASGSSRSAERKSKQSGKARSNSHKKSAA
jgi:hypothetical protein